VKIALRSIAARPIDIPDEPRSQITKGTEMAQVIRIRMALQEAIEDAERSRAAKLGQVEELTRQIDAYDRALLAWRPALVEFTELAEVMNERGLTFADLTAIYKK
jgi:hypothetical protein